MVKKSWVAQFKEFRAYGECVLDYLRSQVGHKEYFLLHDTIKIMYSFVCGQGKYALALKIP